MLLVVIVLLPKMDLHKCLVLENLHGSMALNLLQHYHHSQILIQEKTNLCFFDASIFLTIVNHFSIKFPMELG